MVFGSRFREFIRALNLCLDGYLTATCLKGIITAVPCFALASPAEEGGSMVQRVSTVAFEGIEARGVDVQVQVAPGLPAFTIVCRQ
jgi:hypothetical protein